MATLDSVGFPRRVGRGLAGLFVLTLLSGCGSAAPTQFESPSPTPPSSASAEPTPGPTASPTRAAATATATPARELAQGSLAVTIEDRVVVRSQPRVADDSKIYTPPLPTGTQLEVVRGPVDASGYRWYQVDVLTYPLDGRVQRGWVAIGARDGTPWVAPAVGALAPDPAWHRLADQPGFADARMMAVAAGPDRYVAVGCVDTPDAGCGVGVSWTSTDGRSWRRSTIGGAEAIFRVIAAPQGYLAWGSASQFWASPDGVSWRKSPVLMGFQVTSVVWDGDRFLAAGFATERADRPFIVWGSRDGLAWKPVSDPACSEPPAHWPSGADWWGAVLSPARVPTSAGPRLIASIASSPSAAGSVETYSFSGASLDGRCWSWTPNSPSGGQIDRIFAVNGRLVALGGRQVSEIGPWKALVWTSADGISWAAATVPSESIWWSEAALATDARGIIALGEGENGPSVWRSADGRVWVKASPPDAARDGREEGACMGPPCPLGTSASAVAAGPSGLVAVGSSLSPTARYRAVVWVAK